VVTATAALESGKFTPNTLINGHGTCITVQTVPALQRRRRERRVVSLSDALTFSYNTVFAQVGQAVGQQRLYATMRDYGFFRDPPLDYPSDEMEPSGLYSHGRCCRSGRRSTSAGWRSGRSGWG
jgi:membrane peptidoglycan carboxypeptidase